MTPHPHPTRRRKLPMQIALALLVSIALLAACSGPVAAIQLALGSGSVVLIRGGSVDVDVVLTRTGGASGPVTLAVTGLPANVTASFAPPIVDGAATNSVLTLSATAAAVEGMTTLTVAAAGTSLTAESSLDLSVESLAVAGQMVGVLGLPIAGVSVASQGETTFTDADGAFDLDGLSIPYDLTVSSAVDSGSVHVFEGLTTAAPVLSPVVALSMGPATTEVATVSGDVLGGAAVAVDRAVLVCAEGLDLVVIGCDAVGAGDTTYSLGANWFVSTTASVRVHALHMETAADGTPAAYLGYETFDLSLSDTDAEVRDLALAPVASVLVEGSISTAGGTTITGLLGGVRFGPGLTMQLFSSSAIVADVSVLMPAPSGATYDFTAIAEGATGVSFAWTVDQSPDFGSLTVPTPLALGTPADAAVGVDLTTPFTSSGSEEVRTYLFEGSGPDLAITTTRASVTVPDPASGGFAFPAGANYSWLALGHGSIDADAALNRSVLDYLMLLLFSGAGGPGFDQSGVFTLGTDRDFTFAP